MKRVFILASHPLFGECLQALLGQDPEVQIVGHTRDLDLGIAQIRSLQPDVVIVDSKEPDSNCGQVMLQIIKEEFKTEVVGLSLSDNKVVICHGEQRTIRELADFLVMITAAERND